jgi:4-oxalocrotonate tautomerase
MPEVYIHLVEGRTIEQKRALVADITAAVVLHAKVPPEAVMIEILDVPRHNKAKAGVLFSDR